MTAMRDRAVVGSVWERRRDRTRWLVIQSHRTDRLAELVPAERTNASIPKDYIPFAVLRTRFTEVPTAPADTGVARAPGQPRAGKEPRP